MESITVDTPLSPEGVKPLGPHHREVDSLDDFEHLGHDSAREPALIDTREGDGGGGAVRHPQPEKMDSNLLDKGDVVLEPKLDLFIENLEPLKHEEPPEFKDKDKKSATLAFVEAERQRKEEVLERYSDSEPEDYKPSKTEHFPKKQTIETFKDVEEAPTPPKKDYPEQEPKIISAPPTEAKKSKGSGFDAEAIFCSMGLDAWFNPERLNPKVESLIYWRDPKKSGPVFGGILVVLLALTYFSLISVVAYLSLLGLTGTISFRIYKNVVQAVQKTGDGHPFKDLLELDISLPREKVKEVSDIAIAHVNAAVVELRRLFLVEDLVDSIKFGVFLWTLTYVGSWFNGMTLIIISWVALFTLPKVYETNKTQIDANLDIVRTKLAEITSKVKAAIPIGKKSEEEKKEQ